MKPTSGACTMPRLSQACLLGYTPSPQQAFQGDATHQAQRRTWLTPNDSPGTWYTQRDYRSLWTLHPFHRTVFTAHTWSALPTRDDGRRAAAAAARRSYTAARADQVVSLAWQCVSRSASADHHPLRSGDGGRGTRGGAGAT